jgi:hypothetical protein
MSKRLWVVLGVLSAFAIGIMPASAQTSEVKEKPPMYTYVANWAIPRAQWGDVAKANAADLAILQKAVAGGTLVGFGSDETMIHQADGATHDNWWSSTSMAGLLNVLDQFYKSGTTTSPVLASATKHWDSIYISRYYNYHSGSWKGVYTHGGTYKLKKDAPDDALEVISKNLVVPLMEKMLAEGNIHEYEIDTEAIHTESPDSFFIYYVAASAEGLDKVTAALQQSMKSNPLGGPAFGAMVDTSEHRDYLARTDATYK